MALFISAEDLEPFAAIEPSKANAMIGDAEAQAIMVAPCLSDPDELTEHQQAAVKAIMRSALLRWNDAGSGAFTQQTAGPFSVSVDNRQTRRSLFWPTEIEQLQQICAAVTGATSGAFSVDTAPGGGLQHSPICSLNFGAVYCSCGATLTLDGPLWGGA